MERYVWNLFFVCICRFDTWIHLLLGPLQCSLRFACEIYTIRSMPPLSRLWPCGPRRKTRSGAVGIYVEEIYHFGKILHPLNDDNSDSGRESDNKPDRSRASVDKAVQLEGNLKPNQPKAARPWPFGHSH